MVKPVTCPIKPKTTCSKRLANKRKVKSASKPSTTTPNGRLTGEELQEMRRLAEILPIGMRAQNPQNDPLLLIHNATNYINQLTSTLVARVQNGSLSQDILRHLPSTTIDAARRLQTLKPKKSIQKSTQLRRK